MDNKETKHGFSGLSDLASEVSIDDAVSSEPKLEKPSSSATEAPSLTSRENPGNQPEQESPTSPPPIEIVSSGKSNQHSGWKWVLGIVGVIVVIWIANNGGQDTKKSSPNTRSLTHTMYERRPSRSTLAREIENGKLRAKQMEAQIRGMDGRLEDYERRMKSYRAAGMVDEYNMLVPSFNSLLGRRNDLYEKYRGLIGEVNAKVKRYNAGYR